MPKMLMTTFRIRADEDQLEVLHSIKDKTGISMTNLMGDILKYIDSKTKKENPTEPFWLKAMREDATLRKG